MSHAIPVPVVMLIAFLIGAVGSWVAVIRLARGETIVCVIAPTAFVASLALTVISDFVNPMGGMASLGRVSDGHFFLGSHGALIEVSRATYLRALAIEYAIASSFSGPIGASAGLGLGLRRRASRATAFPSAPAGHPDSGQE